MLEALEMESRILWNFRLVVLNATDIILCTCEKMDELQWGGDYLGETSTYCEG